MPDHDALAPITLRPKFLVLPGPAPFPPMDPSLARALDDLDRAEWQAEAARLDREIMGLGSDPPP